MTRLEQGEQASSSQEKAPSSPAPTATPTALGTGRGVERSILPYVAKEASDIHGWGNKQAKLSQVMEVAENLGLTDHQKKLVQDIYSQARNGQQDRGADIIRLLPFFKSNPELLERVSSVANAKQLFGTSDPMRLTGLKSSFLCDLLQMTNQPAAITQGSGPLCTATTAIQNALTPEQFVTLTTDYALNGIAYTKLGQKIEFRPEFLKGVNRNNGGLDERKVYAPSDGVEAFIQSVMAIATPADRLNGGAYRQEYCEVFLTLSGKRTAFRSPAEQVTLDSTGQPKLGLGAVQPENTSNWLNKTLKENKEKANPKGIPVDISWGEPGTTQHIRHMSTAILSEKRFSAISGQVEEMVLLRNSQGIRLKDGKEIPAGTVMGNDQFKYEVASTPAHIWISSKEFNQSLQGIVLMTDEDASLDNRPDVTDEPESEIHYLEPEHTDVLDIKRNEQTTDEIDLTSVNHSEEIRLYQEEVEEVVVQDGDEGGAALERKRRYRTKDEYETGGVNDEYDSFIAERKPRTETKATPQELLSLHFQNQAKQAEQSGSEVKPVDAHSSKEILHFRSFGFDDPKRAIRTPIKAA